MQEIVGEEFAARTRLSATSEEAAAGAALAAGVGLGVWSDWSAATAAIRRNAGAKVANAGVRVTRTGYFYAVFVHIRNDFHNDFDPLAQMRRRPCRGVGGGIADHSHADCC